MSARACPASPQLQSNPLPAYNIRMVAKGFALLLGIFTLLLTNFSAEAQPTRQLYLPVARLAAAVPGAQPGLPPAAGENIEDAPATPAGLQPTLKGAARMGDNATPAPQLPPEPPAPRPALYLPFVNAAPLQPAPAPAPAQGSRQHPLGLASLPQREALKTPARRGPVSLEMGAHFHSQLSETSLGNACGPTSLLIALDYFRIRASLAQVIQRSSLSPYLGGFDPTCTANPACLSPGVLVQVAERYGLGTDAHEGWTFDQLYAALADGRPVIVDVTWGLVPGGSAHFVLVDGLDPEKKIVYYHDPYSGPSRSASWTRFSASWAGPVDLGDPLRPAGHRFWGVALFKP